MIYVILSLLILSLIINVFLILKKNKQDVQIGILQNNCDTNIEAFKNLMIAYIELMSLNDEYCVYYDRTNDTIVIRDDLELIGEL